MTTVRLRRRNPEVMPAMKSYKFQALVTMYADGDPRAELGPAPRRTAAQAGTRAAHADRPPP